MKLNWFTRKGIFFLPASGIGWAIFLGTAAFAVYTFIDIDRRSHSVSDTLINFVFMMLMVGTVYSLVGWLTEKK